jgi:hypothetical protein
MSVLVEVGGEEVDESNQARPLSQCPGQCLC